MERRCRRALPTRRAQVLCTVKSCIFKAPLFQPMEIHTVARPRWGQGLPPPKPPKLFNPITYDPEMDALSLTMDPPVGSFEQMLAIEAAPREAPSEAPSEDLEAGPEAGPEAESEAESEAEPEAGPEAEPEAPSETVPSILSGGEESAALLPAEEPSEEEKPAKKPWYSFLTGDRAKTAAKVAGAAAVTAGAAYAASKYRDASGSNAYLKKEVIEMEETIEQLREELGKCKAGKPSDLEAAGTKLEMQLVRLREELSKAKAESETCAKDKATLNEQLAAASAEVATCRSDLAKTSGDLTRLEAELSTLREETTRVVSDAATTNSDQAKAAAEQIAARDREIESLQAKVALAEAEAKAAVEATPDLERVAEEARNREEILRGQIDTLTEQARSLAFELEEVQKTVAYNTTRADSAEAEKEACAKQSEELRGALDLLRAEFENQIEACRMSKDACDRGIITDKTSESSEKLSKILEDISARENDLRAADQRLSTLTAEVQAAEKTKNELAEYEEKLKKRIDEYDALVVSARKAQEMESAKADKITEDAVKAREELDAEVAELQKQAGELNRLRQEQERDIDAYREEAKRMKDLEWVTDDPNRARLMVMYLESNGNDPRVLRKFVTGDDNERERAQQTMMDQIRIDSGARDQ